MDLRRKYRQLSPTGYELRAGLDYSTLSEAMAAGEEWLAACPGGWIEVRRRGRWWQRGRIVERVGHRP